LPAAFVSLVMSSYHPNFPFGVNIARFLLVGEHNTVMSIQLPGHVDTLI